MAASGLIMQRILDKNNKCQGRITIRLSISSEKNRKVASQEHRHLLRVLLMHELVTSNAAPYEWCGKFNAEAEAVRGIHSVQSVLSATDCALAQWSVFTAIHANHPLAFDLFDFLLDKVFVVSDDDIKLFWDSVRKLLPSCFAIIRKLRNNSDKSCVKILTRVLSVVSKLALLKPPEGTDLFPSQLYR